MNKKGFTLVELMIVISITGLLAMIVLPKIQNYQNKAKTVQARVGLSRLYQDLKIMHDEHGVVAPCFKLLGFRFPPPQLNASRYSFGMGWVGFNSYRVNYQPLYNLVFGDIVFPGIAAISCLSAMTPSDDAGTMGQFWYRGGGPGASHHASFTNAGTMDILGGEFVVGAASNLTEDYTDDDSEDINGKINDYWTINHEKNIVHERVGY